MDLEAAVVELSKDVACQGQEVDNLKGWQKRQNGSLIRMEDRVGRIEGRLLSIALAVAGVFAGTILEIVLTVVIYTKCRA